MLNRDDYCLDIVGREIKVGDTVAYAVFTRDGGMQLGEVQAVIPKVGSRSVRQPDGTFKSQKTTNWTIKVRSKTSRYDYNQRKYVDGFINKTLPYQSRFVVVEPLPAYADGS